jgi:two-component system nitrogen regulation response regulator GlnG
MSRVLIVDDEPSICWSFDQALTDAGHEVRVKSTAEAAIADLEHFVPDAIVLDFRLPGMDGLTALRELRKSANAVPVILMTAFGSLDLVVQALDDGAFDYLPKPFDLDTAINVVTRALRSRVASDRGSNPTEYDPQELVGESRVMQEVFRQIALVAPLDVPVLLTGESGVGKELIAGAIHRYSRNAQGKLVPICVPAMSPTILESQLFGHVKGAFTGADRDRPGLLDSAHGGSAFFDEIGEIALSHQVKLLRVLEDRQIIPVGGSRPHPSAFRLIAATNRSLEQLVARGAFREDLYYRISTFRIHIPPLRDRLDDVPLLANRFLKEVAAERLTLSAETVAALQRKSWPGNVRELRSAIHYAAVVCRGGTVTPECLPAALDVSCHAQPELGSLDDIDQLVQAWAKAELDRVDPAQLETTLHERFLNRFEPILFRIALEAAKGNRKQAAELLGLHRETLRKRLRKHGMNLEEPED